MKEQVKALLEKHKGRSNAITRHALRNALNIPLNKDRKLRLLIAELRREELPILFATESPAGYYLPESLSELKEGVDKLRSYIIDECIVLRNFKVSGSLYINNNRQGKLL